MTLILRGARQVGKTFTIEDFAREAYPYYVSINFDENPAYRAIFDGDLDVDTLVKQISLRVPGSCLVPGETLLFLDEIQNCPKARTALKFFTQDRRFDVIASGSLLGINYKEVPSHPVGYVEHMNMYSLDFEEFLWAVGIAPESIADIKGYFDRREKVPQAMHERMMELFREFIVVGGMPRVVNEYVTTHDFSRVLKLQQDILADYTNSIAKYADSQEQEKARACFLSIPRQLAKEYKKFQYSIVEKRGTSRKYAGSLQWLYDADIINFCRCLAAPNLPFERYAQSDVFKVYMRDTGLLIAMLEDGSQADIIDGSLDIYKGAIFENIIADIFGKAEKPLYYFEYRSQIEIDFFIRLNKTAAAVEVKSADNTKSKSMTNILRNYGVQRGVKLSSQNVKTNGQIDSLPLYMAMFL
jgi:predicted AAA+ superfamily ATPase